MLRVVLAVLVVVALFGVAMPVVEEASAERSARLADGELGRIEAAATALVEEEEPAPRDSAARRTVEVSLPQRGPTTVGVEYVAVGGVPGRDPPRDTADADVLAYRLADRPPRVRRVPVDVRVLSDGRVRGDSRPLVLGRGQRLVLRLVQRDGDPSVLAGRQS